MAGQFTYRSDFCPLPLPVYPSHLSFYSRSCFPRPGVGVYLAGKTGNENCTPVRRGQSRTDRQTKIYVRSKWRSNYVDLILDIPFLP